MKRRRSWSSTWTAKRKSSSATTGCARTTSLPLRIGCGLPLHRARVHIRPPRPPGPHPRLGRAGLAGDAPLAGRGPTTTWQRRHRRGADARPFVPVGPSGGASVGRCRACRVATAAWAEDTLAALADSCTTLADGTALLVGQILFAADGRRFRCPRTTAIPPSSPRWPASTPTSLRTLRPACLRTAARRLSCALRPVRTRCRARDR